MKDSQKKKKFSKKISPQNKKPRKESGSFSLEQQTKKTFSVIRNYLKNKRNLLKISLFVSLANFVLLVATSYLIKNTDFAQDKKVLSVESFVYPQLEATHSALFVSTPAYIVYDPDARLVIAEKNSRLRFTPASSAKIMTALVATDSYDLNKSIKVPNLDSVEGSRMGLFEGEEITVRNLLYGLMLPSGNDSAFTLASAYSTGYIGFVQAMNNKAKELDLDNTYFVDPAGYDDANYTTAYDMARLGEALLQNSTLKDIVSTKKITVPNINDSIHHNLSNLNELLGFNGVDGIKTGFTEEAGGVLVTSLIHDGRRYIIVLFKSQDRFYDTRVIMGSIIDSIRLITY